MLDGRASNYRAVPRLQLEDTLPDRARWWAERVNAWATAQDIAERSKRTYAEHLRRFPRYLDQLGREVPQGATDVTREDVLAFKHRGQAYARKRQGQPLAITTRAMDLGLLRSFLAFEGLGPHGAMAALLALDDRLFRFHRGQVRAGSGNRMESAGEIARVLAAALTAEARAVIVLGVYGGLRAEEARRVAVQDLELDVGQRPSLRVRRGKWGKPRSVLLPRHARNLLLAAAAGKSPGDRIYPWSRSKHRRDLMRACDLAGTRPYTPHDLRRTYAAMMFEAGAPLEAVQDQLGHEDPRTTRLYQGPVRVTRAVEQLEALLGA